ncbi:hypothetical protein JCM10296v2_001914 [Rhodotorula toruloides]
MIPQSDPSPILPARATRQRKPRTDANYVYDDPAGAIASSSWSSAPPSASSTSFPSAPTAPTNVAAQPLASTSKRRMSSSSASPDSQPRKRSKGKSGKTSGGDVKAGKKGKERSGRASEEYREKTLDEELEAVAAEEAAEEALLDAKAFLEAFLEAIAEEAEEDDGATESSDTEYVPDVDADDADDADDEEPTAPKKRRRTGRGVKALTAQETRRVFTAGAPSSSPLRPTEAQRTSFFDKIEQVQAEWKTDNAQVAKELATWGADWARTKAIAAQNGVQLDDRRRIDPSGSVVQPALVLMHYAPSPTVPPEGRRHSHAPHENKTTRKHEEAGLGSGGIAFLDLHQQSFRIPSYDKLDETKVGHPPPEKDVLPRINEEIWKEVSQPRLHDTLIRRMNGSLAYPTLTHVEGTHAAHPTRAALREIKKDQALDVFEESVAFKHEGVKNEEGWWAKGEQSVQLVSSLVPLGLYLVPLYLYLVYLYLVPLDLLYLYLVYLYLVYLYLVYLNLLSLDLLSLDLLSLDLLGLVLSIVHLGLPLAILACRILRLDRPVPVLVRVRLALPNLSRLDHLGAIPPSSLAPAHPVPASHSHLLTVVEPVEPAGPGALS